MIKKASTRLLRRSSHASKLLALRSLARNSYLSEMGWFRSVEKSMAIDASGEAIPWYTYGAIRFLAERVPREAAVFEYGSGNSTLWWSRRCGSVVSCEHDREWHAQMAPRLPPNVRYVLSPLDSSAAYAQQIRACTEPFDIVIIDGRDRVSCAKKALQSLKPDGVVIWDNSDRPEYQAGYDELGRHGFRRLDFWGMGPINVYGWCTSIFYRPENCLHI